jgi:hypothetical protein
LWYTQGVAAISEVGENGMMMLAPAAAHLAALGIERLESRV